MNGTGDVPVPSEWANLGDPDTQTIVVEVLVSPGTNPTATATANGHSVGYEPVAPEAVPGCD